MKNMKCLLKQTRFLSVFYIGFSLTDLLMMGLGNLLFKENKDFNCLSESTVVAKNTGGAFYLLFYSILLLLYSLTLWFIFYRIPADFGLVDDKNVD
jgi:hypothetical protein